MRTMHTVLKHGGLVWLRDVVPPEMFPPRVAQVQAMIAAAGHDAWLVYGDAERYGDLAYLTHFLPRVRGAVVLVPRAGAPTLLVAVGTRDVPAAKTLTWVHDVRPFTLLPGEVVKLVRERGLERARIGLVGIDRLPIGDWAQIQALLPDATLTPASQTMVTEGTAQVDGLPVATPASPSGRGAGGVGLSPLAALRAAKEPAEIAVMRHTASLVGDGLAAAATALQPGATERDVLAAVDRRLRYGAAEDVRLLVASGPRASLGLRPADDRRLGAGEVVLLHVAVEYQRYWAEAGQTFVLGAADAPTRALVERAERAVAAMADSARPGAPAAVVAGAARLGAPSDPAAALAASYGLGHGIGLDLEESPYLRPDDPTPLVEGAVLALHVVLHGEVGAGALATRLVLVGPRGVEPLLGAPALRELSVD